jgi:aspartate/methionine/tyrosine aminotransferase
LSEGWREAAAYMEWAKLHSSARYNLATSGLGSLPLRELPVSLDDLEITGESAYGYEPLLEAVARHTGAAPENVVLAAGTSMANHLALAGVLEPGDEVLIEAPAYPMMAAAARYLRAQVTTFPRRMEDGYRIDPDQVRSRLSPHTRAIVVTDLHNPSSVRAEAAALRALAALAEESGAWLLVDEVYLEVVFEQDVRSAWHLGPRVLATSSLTKAYGLSGLRCGWILAPAETARTLWRLNDVFAASAAHIPERLGVIAFQNLASLRERARARLQAHRGLLNVFLEGRDDLESVAVPWGTTAFPRLREGAVDALCARLRDVYETSVVPGRFFGAERHFRIGLGGETSELQEGLARLGQALDDLRAGRS